MVFTAGLTGRPFGARGGYYFPWESHQGEYRRCHETRRACSLAYAEYAHPTCRLHGHPGSKKEKKKPRARAKFEKGVSYFIDMCGAVWPQGSFGGHGGTMTNKYVSSKYCVQPLLSLSWLSSHILSLQSHKACNSNAGPHFASGSSSIKIICGVSSALLALLYSPVHVHGVHNMSCKKIEHVNLLTNLRPARITTQL